MTTKRTREPRGPTAAKPRGESCLWPENTAKNDISLYAGLSAPQLRSRSDAARIRTRGYTPLSKEFALTKKQAFIWAFPADTAVSSHS